MKHDETITIARGIIIYTHDTEIRIQRAYTEPYPYASYKLNVIKSLKLCYRCFSACAYRVMEIDKSFVKNYRLAKHNRPNGISSDHCCTLISSVQQLLSRKLQQYLILLQYLLHDIIMSLSHPFVTGQTKTAPRGAYI